jgi:mRNA interferase YafQ
MKLEIIMSNKFKKDLKTAAKRNYDLGLLNEVVDTLASGLVLPPKYRDHMN